MKKASWLTVLLSTMLLSLIASVDNSQAVEKKTLSRWPDPVIVSGEVLPELDGTPLENIRVYASNEGIFEPIRFQIDEKTKDLDWVLPGGPKANGHLSNGFFDIRDVLLFMADDSGDRVAESEWPPGYEKGLELEIIDPLNQDKGWIYVLSFTTDPPPLSSLPPYIHYSYENEEVWTDYYHMKYIVTEDGMHTTYYKKLTIPESTGGNGENIADRLKIRTTVKLFFGLIPIRMNEETLFSDILAYKVGPIRVNRRLDQYIQLPFGLKALRAITDIQQYRNIQTCPIRFEAPIRIDRVVSSMIIRFGTDYAPAARGSMLYNSSNPRGFLVDGKMDEDELKFNPEFDNWRVLTGKTGTFLTRSVFTPEILETLEISMGLIDDDSQPDPPERYPGNIGFLWQDWNVGRLEAGVHYFYLEFYYPPHYKLGDEVPYLNYFDYPLEIAVGEHRTKNQIIFQPNVGKDFYRD